MTLKWPTPSLPSQQGSSAAGERRPLTPFRPSPFEKASSNLSSPVNARSALAPAKEAHMDSTIVEELTSRLPTSELVKIIKGALECGRRNMPFTESELLRAMTFGVSSTFVPAPRQGRDPSTRR